MKPNPNKRYLIGPEEDLRALFPEYKGNDERTLSDGSLLIEVNCTEEQLKAMETSSSIKAYTHEEILAYLAEREPTPESKEEE